MKFKVTLLTGTLLLTSACAGSKNIEPALAKDSRSPAASSAAGSISQFNTQASSTASGTIVCRYNFQLTNTDPYRAEKAARIGTNQLNQDATVISVRDQLAGYQTELRPDLRLLYFKQHAVDATDSRTGYTLATAEIRQDASNVCSALGYLGLSPASGGLNTSSPGYANVTVLADVCCGPDSPTSTCGSNSIRCGDL
jgi:hypothetical protein